MIWNYVIQNYVTLKTTDLFKRNISKKTSLRGSYVVILVVVFFLPVILIASIGMTPAFGLLEADELIVVATDKASYSDGDTILVTGEVRDMYPHLNRMLYP